METAAPSSSTDEDRLREFIRKRNECVKNIESYVEQFKQDLLEVKDPELISAVDKILEASKNALLEHLPQVPANAHGDELNTCTVYVPELECDMVPGVPRPSPKYCNVIEVLVQGDFLLKGKAFKDPHDGRTHVDVETMFNECFSASFGVRHKYIEFRQTRTPKYDRDSFKKLADSPLRRSQLKTMTRKIFHHETCSVSVNLTVGNHSESSSDDSSDDDYFAYLKLRNTALVIHATIPVPNGSLGDLPVVDQFTPEKCRQLLHQSIKQQLSKITSFIDRSYDSHTTD